MKKLFLTIWLLGTMIAVPVLAQSTTTISGSVTTDEAQRLVQSVFSDVSPAQVNYVAIKFLKEQDVFSGYPDGTFKPDSLVNRAEALKILLLGNRIETPTQVDSSSFPDVNVEDWYAKYVEKAKLLEIIKGNDDGTFAPARNVTRAEFFKMLLILNNFLSENWTGKQLYADVPADVWFSAYLNYAGQSGLLVADPQNNLFPARELTRGEVAEILYLLLIIRNDQNTALLISQTEAHLAQIETYMGADNLAAAKRAADLAVDFSQQALRTAPDDKVVLGAAKVARAYNFLMKSYIAALQKDFVAARDWANQSIVKATEALEVNNEVQSIAAHIKDRANELLAQFPAA